MKKLYSFIQMLLNLLTKAYKKINELTTICKMLEETKDENWELVMTWNQKWLDVNKELNNRTAYLCKEISEWKESHDHWQHAYAEKADALTRAINIIKALTGAEETPYTEQWTEETNKRYSTSENIDDVYSEWGQEDDACAKWILQNNWAELDNSAWQYADTIIASPSDQILVNMKLDEYDDNYRWWVEHRLGILSQDDDIVCLPVSDEELESEKDIDETEWTFWMTEVCRRYPTEEEEHNRYMQLLEDNGCIEAYYAMKQFESYDPFYDSDDELYNGWCLKNNLDKDDFEAKKYNKYNRDCYYCHYEPEMDEADYCAWAEKKLGIKRQEPCSFCEHRHETCEDCTCKKSWFEVN